MKVYLPSPWVLERQLVAVVGDGQGLEDVAAVGLDSDGQQAALAGALRANGHAAVLGLVHGDRVGRVVGAAAGGGSAVGEGVLNRLSVGGSNGGVAASLDGARNMAALVQSELHGVDTVTASAQSASSLIVLPLSTLATASAKVGYITPSIDATAEEITKGLKPLVVKVRVLVPKSQ